MKLTPKQEQDKIRELRLELEVLEKQAQEAKYAEEKETRAKEARRNLKEGWDDQLRYERETPVFGFEPTTLLLINQSI